ncbi:MAG: hypothetical protein ACC657_16380 [Thiohalomonadales bacterium]
MIYLDWNVIVHLINGDYPELQKAINFAKLDGKFIIPFTSTHVEEATNIKSKSEQKQRLQFLSELSENNYFENSVTDLGLVKRHPTEVYNTITEVWIPKGLMRKLGNIITRPMLMLIRKLLKLDPQKLNNIPPNKVWGEIDQIIKSSNYANKLPAYMKKSPIREILKFNEDTSIEQFGAINESFGVLASRAIASDMKVASLYSLLETFGYYPEKKKTFEKASRFADGLHCYYSQWSEICVSRDKGFRAKSQAIASLTNSTVRYVAPEYAHEYINQLVGIN